MAKEITVKTTMEELVEGIYNSLLDDFKDLEIPEEYYNKLVVEVSNKKVLVKIPYRLSPDGDHFFDQHMYVEGHIISSEDRGFLGTEYNISFDQPKMELGLDYMVIKKRADEYLYQLIRYFGIPKNLSLSEFTRMDGGKIVHYYRISNSIMYEDIDIFEKFSD